MQILFAAWVLLSSLIVDAAATATCGDTKSSGTCSTAYGNYKKTIVPTAIGWVTSTVTITVTQTTPAGTTTKYVPGGTTTSVCTSTVKKRTTVTETKTSTVPGTTTTITVTTCDGMSYGSAGLKFKARRTAALEHPHAIIKRNSYPQSVSCKSTLTTYKCATKTVAGPKSTVTKTGPKVTVISTTKVTKYDTETCTKTTTFSQPQTQTVTECNVANTL